MLPSYFKNTLSQIIILPFYLLFILFIIYFIYFYIIWEISESKAYGSDISGSMRKIARCILSLP